MKKSNKLQLQRALHDAGLSDVDLSQVVGGLETAAGCPTSCQRGCSTACSQACQPGNLKGSTDLVPIEPVLSLAQAQ